MDGAARSPATSLEKAKADVVDVLSECFAQDHLSLGQFERLLDAAQGAQSAEELGKVVERLPPGAADFGHLPVPPPASGSPEAQVPAVPAPSPSRRNDQAIAVFGEAKRQGAWAPAAETKAVAVMGSVELDFREAALPPGDVTVFAVTFFGSVEIVVPPTLQVECAVSAVFGSAEHEVPKSAQARPDSPRTTLHVRGVSVLGSVEIHYRHPGETKREAKRRRRVEKRERRRIAKRSRRD